MHPEAERLEHAVSETLVERMAVALGYPAVDSHGDPIPDADGFVRELACTPLADIAVGQTVEIRRVDEREPERLRYLGEMGLVPGVVVTVRDRQPFGGPVTVEAAGEPLDFAGPGYVLHGPGQLGHQQVADIGDAYRLLTPRLGTTFASTLFALALLASGQNSTITGTLAGQIVMEDFLDIRLPAWLRRLITRLIAIIPAVIVSALHGEDGAGSLLILSQVILSLQLARSRWSRWSASPASAARWACSSTRPHGLGGALVIGARNAWLLNGTFRQWLA